MASAATPSGAATTATIKPQDVCIVGAARTPLGSYGGALSTVSATDLGAIAIQGALKRSGVAAAAVQEVVFGNVMSAGLGQAPARQCAVKAGLATSVPCTTVNKVCSSGMKAITMGAAAIMLGLRDVVVAGGAENMSQVPHYVHKFRFGCKYGHQTMEDGVIKDGLWDAPTDQHMGNCAELCASMHGITREEQDLYAAESYRRAQAAIKGSLEGEVIEPVIVKSRRSSVTVSTDEEPTRNAASAATAPGSSDVPASLSRLRPAFQSDGGTVTAGNASPLSDGAAAVVLVSGKEAARLKLRVLAVIRGFDDAAQESKLFTTSPALAIPKAIERAGLAAADIGVYEINEAFSVVALANTRLLKLDPSVVNIFGGAVATGHPLGCSGARIIVTLIAAMQHNKQRYGCAGVCNGGGGASAVVLEAVSQGATGAGAGAAAL